MFRTSLDMLTELGARQDTARVLNELSRSLLALGDEAAATRSWREALRISTETQGMFVTLEALTGLATLQAKRGEIEEALELLFIILDHPASIQDTKDRAEQMRGELEAHLTPQQVIAVQTRARSGTLEATVTEILSRSEFDR